MKGIEYLFTVFVIMIGIYNYAKNPEELVNDDDGYKYNLGLIMAISFYGAFFYLT